MTDFNELAIRHYSNYVVSDEWAKIVLSWDEVSQDVVDIIQKFGIGTKLDEKGNYDFESGCLYDDIPSSMRGLVREEASGLMNELAESFSAFVKNLAD